MTTPRRDVVDAVHAALLPHADPVRAAGQQRYMKSRMPYLGLTSPTLRATLRPVLGDTAYRIADRSGWEATVRALWDEATHREHWYAALTLLQHRRYGAWRDPELRPLVRHLVVTGAWWDVVDELATHVVRGLLLGWPETMAPVLRTWACDDHLWVRRCAMLAQVGAGARTDPQLLADVLVPNIGYAGEQAFFSRKAIGWALRDYARTQPTWVRAFVEAHPELSGLSRREALKHL